jgi:hypothetical protein
MTICVRFCAPKSLRAMPLRRRTCALRGISRSCRNKWHSQMWNPLERATTVSLRSRFLTGLILIKFRTVGVSMISEYSWTRQMAGQNGPRRFPGFHTHTLIETAENKSNILCFNMQHLRCFMCTIRTVQCQMQLVNVYKSRTFQRG